MLHSYSIKNYRTTHFQYQQLNKIHGRPTLDTILLVRQLKINAQSVPTTLGGSQLGYLKLVIKETAYNDISNSRPFDRPQHPGPFIINISAAGVPTRTKTVPSILAAVVTQKKSDWDEKVQLYNECQAIEQALRQQLIEAVEPEYLDALRDPTTHMIQYNIPDIIEHLQLTYGFLTDEDLSDRENVLKQFVYDPTKTIDNIFNIIVKHQDLYTIVNNPLADKQQVSIAYKIFNRSRLFQSALMK